MPNTLERLTQLAADETEIVIAIRRYTFTQRGTLCPGHRIGHFRADSPKDALSFCAFTTEDVEDIRKLGDGTPAVFLKA